MHVASKFSAAVVVLALVATGFFPTVMNVPTASGQTSSQFSQGTEINWKGIGVAIPPRNASSVRYNVGDSAVLQLPDGTFRMYYGNFSEPANQYNTCPPDCPAGTSINSAVSKDGIHWTVESGTRIAAEHYCPPAINSVFRFANGTIRLYTGCGLVYDSNDGLNFVQLSKMVQAPQVTGSQNFGVSTIIPLANGQYRMYKDASFNGADPRYTVVRIYSFISSDGFSFTQESGVRLGSSLQYGDSVIRDRGHPLVCQLANGTWIMYFDTYSVNPPVSQWPGDPNFTASPVGVAISEDGLNWNVTRPTFVESGESYQVTAASSGTEAMVFGYYDGVPGSTLPSYATFYGGGLYYALPFYHIISGGMSYPTSVITTSQVSSWTFNGTSDQISFGVSAASQSFINFTFPFAVLSGPFQFQLDGKLIRPTTSSNSTHISVYVTYASGSHTLKIVGTGSTTQSTETLIGGSTTATSPSTTASSTPGGSGIPEFPYQVLAVTISAVAIIASYLVVRRRRLYGQL